MTKDDWIDLVKSTLKSWDKMLLWLLIALVSYCGWYKSLFFIPYDWKFTNEDSDIFYHTRDYLALWLSIGTPSLLFWIYNKKKNEIKKLNTQQRNLEQKFYESLYRSSLEQKVLEHDFDLKERINEVKNRLDKGDSYFDDVVLLVMLRMKQPLEVDFQGDVSVIQSEIDAYINLAYTVKRVFNKTISKELINLYPEIIDIIAVALLGNFLNFYKKSEYLVIDKDLSFLNKVSKPVADLLKRDLNIVYQSEHLERRFGAYTFQQNDFDLEVLSQYLSKEENRELLKSNFAQFNYRMVF